MFWEGGMWICVGYTFYCLVILCIILLLLLFISESSGPPLTALFLEFCISSYLCLSIRNMRGYCNCTYERMRVCGVLILTVGWWHYLFDVILHLTAFIGDYVHCLWKFVRRWIRNLILLLLSFVDILFGGVRNLVVIEKGLFDEWLIN
jgi:hypothetical protein